MDFGKIVSELENYLSGGGDLILDEPGRYMIGTHIRGRAYTVLGYPSVEAADRGEETFTQGAAGLGQFLWRLEELAADSGGLSAWKASGDA